MSHATQEEIIEIAAKMAQELQDIIGDAEKAGCQNPLPGVKALIDEWEDVFSRTQGSWMKKLAHTDNSNSNLLDIL